MPHSRWCTAAPPELPFPFPHLDKVPLKAAGAADGSIACHDRSARISDCIILPWWSSSETGQQRVLPISHFGSSTAHSVPVMSNRWQGGDTQGRERKKEVAGTSSKFSLHSFLPSFSGQSIRELICCSADRLLVVTKSGIQELLQDLCETLNSILTCINVQWFH